ncbi:MAG: hypothetical protein AAGF85_08490 [Bacteroidota bacterium]
MKTLLFIILTSFLISFSACNSEEVVYSINCDDAITPDNDRFNNAVTDFFTLLNVTLEGDCLKVEYSSSGCSGNSWVMELVDAETIKESNPIQRDLRLILKNEEECLAVFTKEISFDLRPIRTDDNTILLNLEDQQYIYTY